MADESDKLSSGWLEILTRFGERVSTGRLVIVLLLSPFPIMAFRDPEQFRSLLESLFREQGLTLAVSGWVFFIAMLFILSFYMGISKATIARKSARIKDLEEKILGANRPTLSDKKPT